MPARARVGRLLNEKLKGVPGIRPHHADVEDRCTFWFYLFRIDSSVLRCDRDKFCAALRAEGVPSSPGYIPMPLYKYPV
ncbi:MAG: glutamine--scyllo-inositol aminotransferase, partial [Chloroflexota bacterium]